MKRFSFVNFIHMQLTNNPNLGWCNSANINSTNSSPSNISSGSSTSNSTAISALNSCSNVNMHSQNPIQFHTHSLHHTNSNSLNNANNNSNCQNLSSLANHIVTNPSISNFMPYNPFAPTHNLLSSAVNVQTNGLSSLSLPCNYSPVNVTGDHRSSSIATLRLKSREHVALGGL